MKTMSEQRKDTIAHFHSSSFTLALLQADHARGRKGFLPTFLILFLTVTIWKKKKKSDSCITIQFIYVHTLTL